MAFSRPPICLTHYEALEPYIDTVRPCTCTTISITWRT